MLYYAFWGSNLRQQKAPRYEMHKYWGKKPFYELRTFIEKYSKPGDILLDPFSGSGVFVSEAYLKGRNVIGNDLNPISHFILTQSLSEAFEHELFTVAVENLLDRLRSHADFWYSSKCPNCGHQATIIATLRNKDNLPVRQKLKCACSKTHKEYDISEEESSTLLGNEASIKIDSHPIAPLKINSRISARKGMSTDDLFTKRALICHTALMKEIDKIQSIQIKDYLTLAFTSNLANCSKLVPPIKSRSAMAPGAWMTGFHIGENYIENNVFHYFANRVVKVAKGKEDYLKEHTKFESFKKIGQVTSIQKMTRNSAAYMLLTGDAKNLGIQDEKIDYIFTDPPYGDSVPYFEQSIIWNTWLGKSADFDNEIVISDSKERFKKKLEYREEIDSAIKEIWRVLKPQGFFTLTFHSVSGETWYSVFSACMLAGFEVMDIEIIIQKTFAPRQLNRKNSVKGDMAVTFKKSNMLSDEPHLSEKETQAILLDIAQRLSNKNQLTANNFLVESVKSFFEKKRLFADINFLAFLAQYYELKDDGIWQKVNP
jgi:DNA modification methylase